MASLVIVALVGILPLFGAANECSSLDIRTCTGAVDQMDPINVEMHEVCDIARNTSACLNDLASRCPEIMNAPNIDVLGFNEFVVDNCDSKFNKQSSLECLDRSSQFIVEKINSCHDKIKIPVQFKLLSGSYTLNDKKCIGISYLWECVKVKLEARCGRVASTAFGLAVNQGARQKVNYGQTDVFCVQSFGYLRKKRSAAMEEMSVNSVELDRILKKLEEIL